MTAEEFKAEAVGQRRITGQFAALDPCEIKGAQLHLLKYLFFVISCQGWRSPFLQGTGDTMYSVLEEEKFEYDCTWPTRYEPGTRYLAEKVAPWRKAKVQIFINSQTGLLDMSMLSKVSTLIRWTTVLSK